MACVLRSAVGRAASALSQTTTTSALSTRSLAIQPARALTCITMPHPSNRTPAFASSCFTASVKTSLLSTTLAAKTPLLQAASRLGPAACTVVQSRFYHVRVALKRRCTSCYFVRRKGRLFVECKAKPRHKQMQVMSKRKTWKEDYSEGNIERAIYWKFRSEKGYYKLGDNEFARHDWLKGKLGVTV